MASAPVVNEPGPNLVPMRLSGVWRNRSPGASLLAAILLFFKRPSRQELPQDGRRVVDRNAGQFAAGNEGLVGRPGPFEQDIPFGRGSLSRLFRGRVERL